MPMLVLQDQGKEQVFEVGPGQHVVGRLKACPIRLPDSSVSRKHATISFDGEVLLVRDESSFNGTYVNGYQIHESTPLRDGDLLEIGTYRLVCRFQDPPPNPAHVNVDVTDETMDLAEEGIEVEEAVEAVVDQADDELLEIDDEDIQDRADIGSGAVDVTAETVDPDKPPRELAAPTRRRTPGSRARGGAGARAERPARAGGNRGASRRGNGASRRRDNDDDDNEQTTRKAGGRGKPAVNYVAIGSGIFCALCIVISYLLINPILEQMTQTSQEPPPERQGSDLDTLLVPGDELKAQAQKMLEANPRPSLQELKTIVAKYEEAQQYYQTFQEKYPEPKYAPYTQDRMREVLQKLQRLREQMFVMEQRERIANRAERSGNQQGSTPTTTTQHQWSGGPGGAEEDDEYEDYEE